MRTMGIWGMISMLFFFAVHRGVRVLKPSPVEYISSYIVYPFLRVSSAITAPIHRWFDDRRDMRDLVLRYKQLQAEHETLQEHYIQARALHDIDEDIKELAVFKKEHSHDNGHIAQVMLRHLSDDAHFFLVDAGAQHGIEPDMVALYKNCIVGRVSHVYPYHCKVTLVSDALCKIAAYCSDTKAAGIHEGLNMAHATTLRHVSHLAKVRNGDLVLSSGEGLIFPRGFAVGTVESYTHDGLLYSITVKPMLDFASMNYCMLIKRGALQ